jgi:23S rRNA pseudouridine2605 synthase
MVARTSVSIYSVKPEQKTRRVGLARALSKLGYCSRSQGAALIHAGRVRLNGSVRRDPETPVDLKQDRILVDKHTIEAKEKLYLMMNKPRGLVTSASDEQGRKTVYSLLNETSMTAAGNGPPGALPWVAPIGRLDKASEGLLLLTNDSEWAARITAPETHLEKTYHVQIASLPEEISLPALVSGVRAADGEVLRVKRARLLRSGQKNCWLEIILDEGKNRHIRRMLAALGVEVLRLVRVAIGPLQLGELPNGALRALSKEEKQLLDRAIA